MIDTKKTAIRIVLADDHAVTRLGIRQVLEAAPDMEVVGEAENGDQAQDLVAELRPDVVLLDLVMPGCSAFEVEKWVRTNHPETVALILTGHDRQRFLAQAVNQGVQGYLTKDQAEARLLKAIRRAVSGECLITDEQIERADRWNREVGQPWNSLTEREQLVLKLFASGYDGPTIAGQLKISIKSVEFHATHIYEKLGVAARVQAVAWYCTHRPDEILPGER
jgi:NarL family two-component system response regulator LiaR